MADDADRSDERIQLAIDSGIERARRTIARALPYIGVCHWCESGVNAGRVFCSRECADDWQHNEDRKKALGR